jgi:ATP-binding cassette subfamily B protein
MLAGNFFFDKYFIIFFDQILKIELKNTDLIFVYLFLFFFLFVAKTFFALVFNQIKWSFITKLNVALSSSLSTGYLNQNFNKIYEKGSPELIRIMGRELDLFTGLITDGFLNIINAFLIIISISLLILFVQPTAFLVSFLFFGLVLIIFKLFTKKKFKELGKDRFNLSKKKIQSINNFFRSIREIKIFNRISFFMNIFKNQLKILEISERKFYALQQSFRPLLEFVGIIFVIVFLIISMKLNNFDTAKVFVEIAVLAAGLFRMMPAVNSLLSFSSSLKYHLPVINLINKEVLDTKNMQKEVLNIKFQKSITFEKISYKYSDNSFNIFEDVSFQIYKGDFICIQGVSGSGKTTLVNLITGLIKPKTGNIIIDKKKKNLSENFILNAAFVSQDPILLDDTIKNNIAFGIEETKIDVKKVIKSLQEAEIYDFIIKKFDGISYPVNEMGSNLSGGQKQRIALARAYYYDAEILILDEPTSALDQKTQDKIIKNLIKKNKTIILITHDQQIKKHCNKVFEIKNKQLIIK